MKIGILLCGHVPSQLAGKYGDYDRMFAQLLGENAFTYETFPVVDGVFPDDADSADGWLITGSKHGVYEDHDWIAPLEALVRDAFDKAIPIIGVCFGHQLLAQALGGTVEKFSGGWSVGHVDYELNNETGHAAVHAFHQDQVTKLPNNASSWGSSDFCQYAFISYGDKAMSMQPHPEFDDNFIEDLLDARGEVLPETILESARNSIGKPLTSPAIGQQMAAFFRQGKS